MNPFRNKKNLNISNLLLNREKIKIEKSEVVALQSS